MRKISKKAATLAILDFLSRAVDENAHQVYMDALATDDPAATVEDSAEAIVRDLERTVGPIARRPTGEDLGRCAS